MAKKKLLDHFYSKEQQKDMKVRKEIHKKLLKKTTLNKNKKFLPMSKKEL